MSLENVSATHMHTHTHTLVSKKTMASMRISSDTPSEPASAGREGRGGEGENSGVYTTTGAGYSPARAREPVLTSEFSLLVDGLQPVEVHVIEVVGHIL